MYIVATVMRAGAIDRAQSTLLADAGPLWVGEVVLALSNALLHARRDGRPARAVERRKATQTTAAGEEEGGGDGGRREEGRREGSQRETAEGKM